MCDEASIPHVSGKRATEKSLDDDGPSDSSRAAGNAKTW